MIVKHASYEYDVTYDPRTRQFIATDVRRWRVKVRRCRNRWANVRTLDGRRKVLIRCHDTALIDKLEGAVRTLQSQMTTTPTPVRSTRNGHVNPNTGRAVFNKPREKNANGRAES